MRTFLVIVFFCPLSFAQSTPGNAAAITAKSDVKSQRKEQYSPFPELATLKRTDPKAYEYQNTQLLLEMQMTLAKFGYGTRFTGVLDAATRSALKEYQQYNHLADTGELDEATWSTIQHDEEAIGPAYRPSLPKFGFLAWDDFFMASGAWFAKDEAQPEPTPATIECYKDLGQCVEAYSLSSAVLQIDTYRIARWDEIEIIAESQSLCGRASLNIGFQAHSVLHIGMSDTTKAECRTPPFDKPHVEVMRLGDGWDWWEKKISVDAAAKRKVIRIPDPVRVKTEFFGTESPSSK
jgi:hypothetical protein